MDFPANSKKAEDRKRVEQITSAKVDRRKKSLTKQFSETLIGGTPQDAIRTALFNVLVPAAKDAFIDAVQSGVETLIRGEVRVRRGAPPASSGATVHYPYNRVAQSTMKPSSALSKAARARHDFDDIVFESRTEADDVIEQLFNLVDQYDSASVADLYALTGIKADHTDNKWGWTDLRGSKVSRTRSGGYLLDLPKPLPV